MKTINLKKKLYVVANLDTYANAENGDDKFYITLDAWGPGESETAFVLREIDIDTEELYDEAKLIAMQLGSYDDMDAFEVSRHAVVMAQNNEMRKQLLSIEFQPTEEPEVV